MTMIEEARKVLSDYKTRLYDKPNIAPLEFVISYLTPAAIPGLDPAIQAALIEFYMGGKPVEGWAWNGKSDLDVIRVQSIGISQTFGTGFFAAEVGFFGNFSLTDPREAKNG